MRQLDVARDTVTVENSGYDMIEFEKDGQVFRMPTYEALSLLRVFADYLNEEFEKEFDSHAETVGLTHSTDFESGLYNESEVREIISQNGKSVGRCREIEDAGNLLYKALNEFVDEVDCDES